jgi:hypothetical protein
MANQTINNLVDFLLISVLARVLIDILSRAGERYIKLLFIRTRRELIIWTHYKYKAAKEGHMPKTPIECRDDKCAEI